MALPQEVERRIRRLALANALEHQGVARPGPILSRILGGSTELRAHAAEVETRVSVVLTEVSGLSPEQQRTELDSLGGPEAAAVRADVPAAGELPALAGARQGEVVLRMAPFPSGALHVGGARMVFVNDYYRKRYAGKLLLVFDDTIGSPEKRVELEFFDLIQKDLEMADVRPDAIYYKSDRVANFYPWARRVIERGAAYVCTCPAELLRENRRAGRACPERGQSTQETLEAWEGMLSGRYREGEAVLRLRTDLHDPDPAFRDRVLLRISEHDHPRVGHRYRVWPMLEFSWAVDDIELGMTHVIRGKDLVIEDRMERFIWDLLGIRGPDFLHWGLLRVREAKLSKSKNYQEVKSGLFDGWADPRTWSFESLDRRGISMAALRQFTLSFGISLADIEVPAETLYAENRALIDATTPRRSVVLDPVKVRVDSFPKDLDVVELANHPDQPGLGRRRVSAGPVFWLPGADVRAHLGEEIRLKDLANIRLPAAVEEPGGEPVHASFTSRENRRLPRVQWAGAEGAIGIDLLQADGTHILGVGEASLREAPERAIYQFERVGFARMDLGWTSGSLPVRACYGHP